MDVNALTIGNRDPLVVLIDKYQNNFAGVHYTAAIELGHCLIHGKDIKLKQLWLRNTAEERTLEFLGTGDKLVMPPKVAQMVAQAILQKAREIEEIYKANQIAADNAVLLRSGAPVGLTDHPEIQKLSLRLAEDVKLPNAVIPQRVLGVPKIIQTPPR